MWAGEYSACLIPHHGFEWHPTILIQHPIKLKQLEFNPSFFRWNRHGSASTKASSPITWNRHGSAETHHLHPVSHAFTVALDALRACAMALAKPTPGIGLFQKDGLFNGDYTYSWKIMKNVHTFPSLCCFWMALLLNLLAMVQKRCSTSP